MNSPGRLSRATPVAVLLWVASAASVRAELSSTSPFLPPQSQASAVPAAPPPLELRGVTKLENETMFVIYDPSSTKKSASWVKLNEASAGGFTVKSYDPSSDTATVLYQGRTLNLVMRTPKIAAAAPVPVAAPPALATVMPATPVVQSTPALAPRPIVPNPLPPTEAARMKEWTDEIQKRREARAQSPAVSIPGQVHSTAPRPAAVPGTATVRPGQ